MGIRTRKQYVNVPALMDELSRATEGVSPDVRQWILQMVRQSCDRLTGKTGRHEKRRVNVVISHIQAVIIPRSVIPVIPVMRPLAGWQKDVMARDEYAAFLMGIRPRP